jgi:hypothetical protein
MAGIRVLGLLSAAALHGVASHKFICDRIE